MRLFVQVKVRFSGDVAFRPWLYHKAMNKASRAACAFTLTAATLGLVGLARPAQAWKPKTHVYLAEQAMKDALDNGKVTIYETDYKTGKIVGVLGEFDVDPKILAALKAAPAQYRAGVLGPDAYPDILTGQQVIHPEESDAIDGKANGSNAWLTHLWNLAMNGNQSPQVQAFVVGYLTHTAGDVFAHTYVNHFAGGEFMFTPDPTNAVKHLILEGYIGKRTPRTISAEGTNVTQNDTSIDGVESFIYNEMTFMRPGSLLEQKLMKGDGVSRSIPAIFSKLRNGLQKDVDEYDRILKTKQGADYAFYVTQNGFKTKYKREWIKDIDDGLKAWPATSHELAKALVYNEDGADMARAREVIGKYKREHLLSMMGAPDGAVITMYVISDIINALMPKALIDAIAELKKDMLNFIVSSMTQKSVDEWADYLKNPDTHFDEVLNRPGGGHDGDVEHPITIAAFNRDYLKIDDTGYQNPNLKWQINELPPAFNTVQLCKMLLLGESGMKQLAQALQAKNAPMGTLQSPFQNVMLGWVKSLDHGNQWQGLPGKTGQSGPRPVFTEYNGAAYRKLFLAQAGEKEMAGGNEHGSSPVPGGGTTPPSGGTTPPWGTGTGTQPPGGTATGTLPPGSGTVSTPPTAPTGERPGASEGFLALKYFEVRVDKVSSDIAGKNLEVLATFKNRTPKEQFLNGSMIASVVTDADGIGFASYGFNKPTGEPTVIAGNQTVAPGGTLQARLLLQVPQGTAPLKTLTLWETSSDPQTVDISTVQWPGVKPAANLAALQLKNGTPEFKPCGKVLDVRFEGFRKARDGAWEAAFSIKNTSDETKYELVQQLQGSFFDVHLHDASGLKVRHDDIARANGDKAVVTTDHIFIVPGSTATLRYRFLRPDPSFVPSKITVTDRASNTTLDWPVSAN